MKLKKHLNAARAAVANRSRQLGVAATALVATSPAFAQTGSGFDSATIIAKITDNGATAVLIVGAMILAVWGIKSMGLFKRG